MKHHKFSQQRESAEADKSLQKFEDKYAKIVAYLDIASEERYFVSIYEGRKTKRSSYRLFSSLNESSDFIEEEFGYAKEVQKRKDLVKQEKKLRLEETKKAIKVGALIHTSFSYTMTFNDFYKVISVKSNKVRLVQIGKDWVSGDIGYTGEVSPATNIIGDEFEASFTVNGLKIKDRYGYPCQLGDTFYENHMD